MRLSRKQTYGEPGLLRDDVERFLGTLPEGRAKVDRRIHLSFWVELFGHRHRNHLEPDELQMALDGAAGGSSHKRHHRSALSVLYQTLNGRAGYNPARGLRVPTPPPAEPRGVSYEVLEQIFAAMDDSPSKRRLRVMALFGLRQKEVGAIRAEDIHEDYLYVRSSKGRPHRVVPIAMPAQAQALAQLPLSQFRADSIRNTWNRAVRRTLGPGVRIRPYDLRHSFGTVVLQATGDQHAVAKLLGHSELKTTDRYTLAAVPARVAAAMSQTAGYLAGYLEKAKPPSTP